MGACEEGWAGVKNVTRHCGWRQFGSLYEQDAKEAKGGAGRARGNGCQG